ncbi:hypothetical protein ACFRAQ_36245 [Nocardia sp. NPDC056611]|uniref:hypothetical protein n=1 Tax=Nocardia sp. NPDC056611 TaxID=3345877 RepID=UPI00366D6D96
MQQLHYIITVQWSTSQNNTSTMSGVVPVNGRTREQLYAYIFGQVNTQNGAPPARTSVLFFSLEPNNLAASSGAAAA